MADEPSKLLGDDGHTRADARLLSRALKGGWDIPEAALRKLPRKMLRIAMTSENERNAIAATRAFAQMVGQNISLEPTEINVNLTPDERRTQALGIVRALVDQPEPDAD